MSGDLGPTMSMGEAVRLTGASRSTMQRRLAAGQIEGAYRNAEGGWVVPMSGLLAAGFVPRTTPAEEPLEADPDEIAALRAEIDRLSAAVAEIPRLRGEIETLSAVNAAQAEHIRDFRVALETIRALPSGPPAKTAEPASVEPEPRRRWWKRSG